MYKHILYFKVTKIYNTNMHLRYLLVFIKFDIDEILKKKQFIFFLSYTVFMFLIQFSGIEF